jgi:hypothetical protein
VCVVTDISEEHAMPEAAQSCERSGIVDKLSCDNIPQDISLRPTKYVNGMLFLNWSMLDAYLTT